METPIPPMALQRFKKTFKNDEAAALESILKKNPTLTSEMLIPSHTDKVFRWSLLQSAPEAETPESLRYAKAEFNEADAVNAAILEFDTFEGNLKADHTDTEFVFSKIRQ